MTSIDSRASSAIQLTDQGARRRGDWLFILPVLAAFVTLAALTMLRHELWRDELQAWSIASQSHSLWDLVRNVRYEAHPPLWFLILYGVTRFTSAFGPVQVLHLLLSAAAVLIFLRYSPFGRLQKLLFVMGYFPLYEYTVISRNYGIGMLLVFAACAMWQERHRLIVHMAVVLGLLAMTNVYMAIIAAGMAVAIYREYRPGRRSGLAPAALSKNVKIGAAVFAFMLLVSVLAMGTNFDTGLPGWQIGWGPGLGLPRFGRVLQRICRGLLPIPSLDLARDGHILGGGISNLTDFMLVSAGAVVGLGLAAMAVGQFLRKRTALNYFLVAFGGIYLFMVLRHIGLYRHDGHFLIALIAGLWIAAGEPDGRTPGGFWARLSTFSLRHRGKLLCTILIAQVIAAAAFVQLDWRRNFSMAQQTADYIKASKLDTLPIGGEADYSVAAVGILLDKDVYYLRTRRWGRHVIWDRKWEWAQTWSMDEAIKEFIRNHSDSLLVMNSPILNVDDYVGLRPVKQFTGAILPDEDFYIYRVEPVVVYASSPPSTQPAGK